MPFGLETAASEYEVRRALYTLRHKAIPDHQILYREGQGGQQLLVMGLGQHHYNPGPPHSPHRMFELLTDVWNEWYVATERRPESRIVVFEGSPRGPFAAELSYFDVLSQGSEQAFFGEAAARHGIEAISAEPPAGTEFHEASQDFTPQEVMRYLGMRYSRQLFWQGRDMRYAASFLDAMFARTGQMLTQRPDSNFQGYDFSFATFAADYQATHGHPYDIKDWPRHLHETVDHMYGAPETSCCQKETPVMQVSQVVNACRDQSFTQVLSRLWAEGRSPLFPMGEAHVAAVKPLVTTLGSERWSFDKFQSLTPRAIGRIAAEKGCAALFEQWLKDFQAGPGSPVPLTQKTHPSNEVCFCEKCF